jgi:nucleoid DNA-binding protein
MNTRDLARALAREHKLPEAHAADHVDRVVHDLIQKLRKGRPVRLPGLGVIRGPRKAGAR